MSNQDIKTGILSRWGDWASRNWGKTLLLALGITVLMSVGAAMLNMEMTFFSIMPSGSEKVKDLQTIVNDFPSANTIFVVVEGDNSSSIKSAVRAIEEELSRDEYDDIVAGVQGTQDIQAFSERLLYLSSSGSSSKEGGIGELLPQSGANLEDQLEPLQRVIDDLLEKETITPLKQEQIAAVLDDFSALMEDSLAQPGFAVSGNIDEQAGYIRSILTHLVFPTGYFINDEQDMALVFVYPTFTVNDFLELAPNVLRIEEAAKQFEKTYNVDIGLTGLTVVGKDEAVTSEQGIVLSSTIAFLAILLLLIFSFRMKSVPLLAGIPLLIGIFWTVGFAGFTLGRLNIMTAMYLVALIGLGIDFAIHFLTAFLQEREHEYGFSESITRGIGKSGRGIVLGGITTAVAFLALIIAESELIQELAIVAGSGILFELLSMFILLPALLGVRHSSLRRRNKPDSILTVKKDPLQSFTSLIGRAVAARPALIAVLFLAAGITLSLFAPGVEVETNIMKMEAKGLESVELQDRMVKKFGMAPDGLHIISDSVDETRDLVRRLEDLPVVHEVDAVSQYIPPVSEQQEVQERVRELTSAYRREMAQMLRGFAAGSATTGSFQAGIPEDAREFGQRIAALGRKAGYPNQQRLEEQTEAVFSTSASYYAFELLLFRSFLVFAEEQITRPFITEESLNKDVARSYFDDNQEHNLITLVPKKNLWIQENRDEFYSHLDPVTYKATGMVMAADQMTNIARNDGVRAAIAAIVVIVLLLLFDFRNIKLALLTVLPLIVSLFSLLGFMNLAGIRFDFINIIAIPLLIGIGIDDAIHISHRYRLEGPGSIGLTVEKIGRAILLTTLTTMIGFASFIPSIMRAMRSTGIVLTIAMLLAFLFSIFMHSAILVLVREKAGGSLLRWRGRST